ncbi:MAG TPA: hypothetical protein VN633_02105 [Bryobacteraceae bacterium]|nr:hypothetical protein [Bryobacteraceae bacterium]
MRRFLKIVGRGYAKTFLIYTKILQRLSLGGKASKQYLFLLPFFLRQREATFFRGLVRLQKRASFNSVWPSVVKSRLYNQGYRFLLPFPECDSIVHPERACVVIRMTALVGMRKHYLRTVIGKSLNHSPSQV